MAGAVYDYIQDFRRSRFLNLPHFFSPKFTLIGTILTAIMVTLLGQYSSLTKSLEALQGLKSDIESATRETLTASAPNSEFIIEVYDTRDEFNLSVSDCRIRFYRLSTTSWHSYPVALACLHWSLRAAKKDGRALLNKMRMHSESESRRRLLGDMKRKVIDKIPFPNI
ncbi:hypothetical protein C8J56DRAFT_888836 [Mycena floridula]|nr:hypothetical protein C8J56DRAFT_888836 [Mycena floridula]